MTYRILGDEFDQECETVDLSDAAYRLHVTMLGWSVDHLLDGKVTARDLARAMPEDYTAVAQELIGVGFWVSAVGGWQIVHHLNRQIDARTLQLKRQSDAERQRRKRNRDAEKSASLTAGSEPNRTEPNQGHAGRHTVSHTVTNPQEDAWAGESA